MRFASLWPLGATIIFCSLLGLAFLPPDAKAGVLAFGLVLGVPMLLYSGTVHIECDEIVRRRGIWPFQNRTAAPMAEVSEVSVKEIVFTTSHSRQTGFAPFIVFSNGESWMTRKFLSRQDAEKLASSIRSYLGR